MEIFVFRKGASQVEEGFSEEEIPALIADRSNLVWVDLQGETPEQIQFAQHILLDVFHFHYLTVEDSVETRNQPKIEAFTDYLYLIVHGIRPSETSSANFVTKELDCYLSDNFVVTFHIERFRSIKVVKEEIRKTSFVCERGAAYLLHQILDHIVDLYMPIVDDFDNAITVLEDRALTIHRNDNRVIEEIMSLRRNVARLRRISARQLDILHRISHGEFPQVPKNLLPFYRDVYDHLLRISDLADSYRDLVGSLFDIHFSVVATRTNDVMKTLAVLSSIILPLSLIAGIYGMNFENMPELKTRNGYFMTLTVMAVVTIVLLIYFWRKGWIFEGSDDTDDDTKTDN
ncbi:MAG: magnesium/cobalt transporter CorA [Acidobacteriota bacterium]